MGFTPHIKYNNKSKQAQKQAHDSVRSNLVRLCDTMVEVAKRLSPYDTGNNRDSIAFEEDPGLTFRVFTAAGYGAYLELGTRRMPARPYFAPAFQTADRELKSRTGKSWEQITR